MSEPAMHDGAPPHAEAVRESAAPDSAHGHAAAIEAERVADESHGTGVGHDRDGDGAEDLDADGAVEGSTETESSLAEEAEAERVGESEGPEVPAPVAEAPAPHRPAKRAERKPAVPAAAPASAAETAATDIAAPEGAVAVAEPPPESPRKWYVVKVTSNREESIKASIERRVKIEGLEEFFSQIVIPVERITQVRKIVEKKKDTGEKVTKEKRVVKENKKFPGYLFAEVEYNDRILYLFRETSGVGDFVGASPHRAPTPMTEREVQAMLHGIVDPKDKKGAGGKTVVKLDYEKGDKVRIREGAFANSEGEVKQITEPKDPGDTPKVTVVVTIWGRPVDVELDYWQVDKA